MSGPTIAAIQRLVAAHYGVTINDLVSARKARDVTRARHIALWLCRRLTPHTASMIGRQFGKRDRSTVASAWRRLEARTAADAELKAEVDALYAMIAASTIAPASVDSPVRNAALALRSEARALEDRVARLDALADTLMASVEAA